MDKKTETSQWTVSDTDAGIRLDKFLAQSKGVSRRNARIWIQSGRVTVKGRVLRVMTKPLRAGTVVGLNLEPSDGREATKPRGAHPPLEILHSDSDVVVVNKPTPLLSESDRFGAPSVESVLRTQLKAQLRGGEELKLVHRLDAGTSGVMVVARSARAVRRLNAAFREGRVRKTYLALAQGTLKKGKDIDAPIDRVKGTKHGVKQGGKPSHTRVVPLESSGEGCLVKAEPTTGRTHQIRVHMASIAMPLLGDRLYGGLGYTNQTPPQAIGRPMLHAYQLTFPHPKTGEPFDVKVAPPNDFVELARSIQVWTTKVDVFLAS